MANPILHKDIIEAGNPFSEAIEGVESFKTKLNELKDGVIAQLKVDIEKLGSLKVTDRSSQQEIARLSEEVTKLKTTIDGLQKKYDELSDAGNRLVNANNNFKKSLKGLNEEQKKQVELASLKAKEDAAQAGSYAKLEATIKRMSYEQKNFMDKDSSKYKVIGEEIAKMTAELEKYNVLKQKGQSLDSKTSLNTQRLTQINKENSEMLAGAKRVYSEYQKQKAQEEAQIKKNNAEMLAGARRVMEEYKKQQADELSSKSSIGSQRSKAYTSTEEYKRQLMYQKLIARENDAVDGSIEKVRARLARVTFEMNKMVAVGSPAFNKLKEEAAQLNAQLKKHEESYGVFGRSVGNYVTRWSNQWLSFYAAIAGTLYTVKKFININAELSDSMAAVRRTTGMTQAEVFRLNETFRNFNTRTAQASLLDLAHVAGKLGIAKDEIAGFVKAADMIGVALGKDLGNNEEAINQLGRIVKIFKVDDNNIGMERALLKIGSALKDLGNASVAEETNIIDFTKRLGGLASAAKVPVDKIMALAATYDILGQTMEVSSTATSQIWIAMIQKTEKFASIAGMSVEEFTRLLKKDFVEAFIAFVEGLSKYKGGMEELGNYFEGLGLDGRRIIGAMTVLSGHVGTFRDQMRLSKRSLDEGKTAAEQFAIQNNTLAASIEKIIKSLQNLAANSGTVDALAGAFNWLGEQIKDMSDWLSNDKLNQLNLELKHYREYYRDAINESYQQGKPFAQMWVNYYEGQIARVQKLIKAEADRRKEEESITAQLEDQKRLTEEMDDLLSNTDRHKNFFGGPDWKWEPPEKPKNFVEAPNEGTMPQVPKQPPSQDQVNKYMKWRIDINAATIDEIVKYEMGELAKQGILEQATVEEIATAEKKIRLEALQKIMKNENEYQEFRISINQSTTDEIVKYEKEKLVERGIWSRLNTTERTEWERRTRKDAEENISKELTSIVEERYDHDIQVEKSLGLETYDLEHKKYEELLKLLDDYKLTGTKEWQSIYDQMFLLEIEYTKRVWEETNKRKQLRDKEYNDTINLTLTNDITEAEVKLAELDAKIGAITSKKVRGKRGSMGMGLSQEDNAELDKSLSERNAIIDSRVQAEINLIKQKLQVVDAEEAFMRLFYGFLTPEQEEKIKQQRRELGLQIEQKSAQGESDKNKTQKTGSDNLNSMSQTFPSWDAQVFSYQTIETLRGIAAYTQVFARAMSDIFNSLSQEYQQQQQSELDAVATRYDNEYAMLDLMVKQKTMSEKVAADKKTELQKKQKAEELRIEKEYKKKQQKLAIAQAVVNTAVGVTQALAQGGIIGIITGALVLAAGLYEISVISGEQFEKGGYGEIGSKDGKKGGVLQGRRHYQGGIKIPGVGEAEGGEYFAIINREATRKYGDQLPVLFDAINNRKYEKMFNKDGVTSVNVSMNDKYGKAMLEEMRKPRRETRVYNEGSFVVYETGNYRLRTSQQ